MNRLLFLANLVLFVALVSYALVDQNSHEPGLEVVSVPTDFATPTELARDDAPDAEPVADAPGFDAEQDEDAAIAPLHTEAREAFRQGEVVRAIALIRRAIAADPGNAVLLNDLGTYELSRGKLEEAHDAIVAAIRADPGYARGYYNLGTVQLKRQEYTAAIESFTKALAINPHHGEARFNRAIAFTKRGDVRSAEQDYVALTSGGRSDVATKASYNLGVLRARQGRFREALPEFRAALRVRPDYADARFNVALLLARQGMTNAAREEYEKLLSIEPTHRAAGLNLGALLMQDQKWDEAARHYATLIEQLPNEVRFHYNLGLCHVQLGDDDAAIVAFGRAVEIEPDYAEAHYNLALALKRVGRVDGSVEHFSRAVALRPDDPAYRYNLALALTDAERIDDAIAQYRAAVELDPRYFRAYYNLGVAELKSGRLEQARADFEAAVRIQPDGYNANYNLGLTLLKMDEAAAAVPVLQTAANLEETVEARYNLGLALGRTGKHRAAIAEYRAALALDPKHAPSIERVAESLSALGDHEHAVSKLALLQKLDPADPSAFNLGLGLYREGRYVDALAYFDVAKNGTESIARKALNMHGATLAKLARPNDAVASYRAALALSPHDGPIVRNMALALDQLGRHQEAIDALASLQDAGDDNALTSYLLAGQYEAVGRPNDALAAYRHALDLNPAFRDAQLALERIDAEGQSHR